MRERNERDFSSNLLLSLNGHTERERERERAEEMCRGGLGWWNIDFSREREKRDHTITDMDTFMI